MRSQSPPASAVPQLTRPVARCVHFLRLHLLGKKIAKVSAPDDANVFGKVKTSGPAFEEAVTGRTVVSVGSQGKYFWSVPREPRDGCRAHAAAG